MVQITITNLKVFDFVTITIEIKDVYFSTLGHMILRSIWGICLINIVFPALAVFNKRLQLKPTINCFAAIHLYV